MRLLTKMFKLACAAHIFCLLLTSLSPNQLSDREIKKLRKRKHIIVLKIQGVGVSEISDTNQGAIDFLDTF